MTTERTPVAPLEAVPVQVPPEDAAIPLTTFVVRYDGSVRGDDMAGGERAAALPYLGRLALDVGHFLGAGEPVALEVLSRTRMSVQITWTQALEATFRAVMYRVPPRTPPHFTVVGGAGVGAAAAHCVQRLVAHPSVEWCGLLASDTRVVAAAGHDEAQSARLAEVGTRMLAVLRAVEASSGRTFVRIDFDGISVLGATLGRHCLFAQGSRIEEDEVGPVIDEVRAILDGHDLVTADTAEGFVNLVTHPPATPTVASDAGAASPVVESSPTPVGARFRHASPPRPRKWRRGAS